MNVFYYIYFLILGTAVGSFLGVVVDRLASKESVWKGRSHCDHCRHNLAPIDLIPLVSFFILGQKCRYCHKRLSWFYPVIEVFTGVCFLLASVAILQQTDLLLSQIGTQLLLLYYLSLISCLIVIFFTDFRYGIIPFKIVVIAFISALIWEILLPYLGFSLLTIHLLGIQNNFISVLLSALGAGGFFLVIFLATKGRGMGFGDVVYAFLMGFILGFPLIIVGLYLAFVAGAAVSLSLVLLKKKKFRGGTIPFGPFLAFGTIISLFYGAQLLSYTMQFLTF